MNSKNNSQMEKPLVVSWDQIAFLVGKISARIAGNFQPDSIVYVLRGGCIPAVILSHELGVRNLIGVNAQRTIGDEVNSAKKKPVISRINKNFITGKKILLVDDVMGSGLTMQLVSNAIQKCNPQEFKTAVIFVNRGNLEENAPQVDFVGESIDSWVVFPWEKQS